MQRAADRNLDVYKRQEFTVSHTDNITDYISDYEPGADNHVDYHVVVYCFTLQSHVRLTLENCSKSCHTLLKRWEDDVVEPIYAASEKDVYKRQSIPCLIYIRARVIIFMSTMTSMTNSPTSSSARTTIVSARCV